jgi:hypothetical protein
MTAEGYNPDEEMNVLIAALPPNERAEVIAERDAEEHSQCGILGGMFVSFDSRMAPEQMAEAAKYLRWLKAQRNADEATDDGEK